MDCVICRYGELALKGKNRQLFENQLVSNMHDCLEKNSISVELKKIRGRIFIFTDDERALSCIKNIFGLVSISPAVSIDNVPEAIKEKVIDYVKAVVKKGTINTFRITTRRTNKDFPKSSNEMDNLLGAAVVENLSLKVDLKNHDLNMGVEIHDKTFIFHEKIPCFGGLPLGISGKVVCLIEDEQGIAAAWLMMKRGCAIFPVSTQNIDISLLEKYSYGSNIRLNQIKELIEINSFAETIKSDRILGRQSFKTQSGLKAYFKISDFEGLQIFDLKNSRRLKDRQALSTTGCKAVISGDRLEEFDPDRYKSIKATILKPLIGYDEKQISALLVRIR